MSRDPRVDAYIDKAADFAKPILTRLRETVHAACPDTVETLKWGMPTFMYKDAILAGMAAFKGHATFNFWRGEEVVGVGAERQGMGQFGRLASVDELPQDVLAALIRKAMALTDAGPRPRPATPPRDKIEMPDDLGAALAANAVAAASFQGFPPSARNEYLQWVVEAKRPETRAKRIAQAVEWLAEGKRRHWKYESC